MPNFISAKIKVDGDEAIRSFNNIGASIRNNVALGNLMATGLTTALSAVTGAVGGLVNAFGESADIIQGNISTADDFAKLSGVSFDEAGGFIDAFSIRMANAAASLPGVTEGYIGIGKSLTDELIPSFMSLDGVLDQDAMAASLDKLSISAGIRADAAGVTISESGRAIAKLLGGQTSIAELARLDFWERNKASLSVIKGHLETQGIELKDMTSKEILDLAQTALEVSDEMIQASSNSVGGMIDGFKSSLLDPTSGLFGFMREIDGRSVMDAAAGTIKKLIGPGGLFYEISQLAETLGLSADPAAMIIDGLDAVTGWLVGLNSFLNTFRAKIVRGVIDPVDFDLGKITSSIGAFAGGLFDRLSSAINSMDVTVIGNRLGLGIAAAIDGIVSFVRNVDFLAIGNAFLKLGMVGVYAIGTAMANVDYGAIAMMWFKGLRLAAMTAIAVIGASIVGVSAPIIAVIAVVAATVTGIFIGIKNFWVSRGGTLQSVMASVADQIASLFRALKDRIAAMLSIFNGSDGPSGFTGRRTMPNKASGLDQMGLFDAMDRERAAAPGANLVVANDTEAIFNRSQQAGLLSALTAPRGGMNVTININGAQQSADEITQKVTQALNQQWRKFSQSQLSASF